MDGLDVIITLGSWAIWAVVDRERHYSIPILQLAYAPLS